MTVISPGPGRLVFLGEEMFPLCEGFTITVTQTHELCHLKRLLSFTCGMNAYTFWMRTLIQLLKICQENHWSFFGLYIGHDSMANDNQSLTWTLLEFHTSQRHSHSLVTLPEVWTGKWKGRRHTVKAAIEPVLTKVISEIETEPFEVFPSYIRRVNLWSGR